MERWLWRKQVTDRNAELTFYVNQALSMYACTSGYVLCMHRLSTGVDFKATHAEVIKRVLGPQFQESILIGPPFLSTHHDYVMDDWWWLSGMQCLRCSHTVDAGLPKSRWSDARPRVEKWAYWTHEASVSHSANAGVHWSYGEVCTMWLVPSLARCSFSTLRPCSLSIVLREHRTSTYAVLHTRIDLHVYR